MPLRTWKDAPKQWRRGKICRRHRHCYTIWSVFSWAFRNICSICKNKQFEEDESGFHRMWIIVCGLHQQLRLRKICFYGYDDTINEILGIYVKFFNACCCVPSGYVPEMFHQIEVRACWSLHTMHSFRLKQCLYTVKQ